mmetsp:Transcript_13061/g.27752  ORF Transcript_13061/g.27752 Transcript_13061/m.27752 type:complete len:110 (+) Transcript_13061:2042-2371(+)
MAAFESNMVFAKADIINRLHSLVSTKRAVMLRTTISLSPIGTIQTRLSVAILKLAPRHAFGGTRKCIFQLKRKYHRLLFTSVNINTTVNQLATLGNIDSGMQEALLNDE